MERDLKDAALPTFARPMICHYLNTMPRMKNGSNVGAMPGNYALIFQSAGVALRDRAKALVDCFEGCSWKRTIRGTQCSQVLARLPIYFVREELRNKVLVIRTYFLHVRFGRTF